MHKSLYKTFLLNSPLNSTDFVRNIVYNATVRRFAYAALHRPAQRLFRLVQFNQFLFHFNITKEITMLAATLPPCAILKEKTFFLSF